MASALASAQGLLEWTLARRERRWLAVAVVAGSVAAVSLWLWARRRARTQVAQSSSDSGRTARANSGSRSLVALTAHEKVVATGFLDKDADEVQTCGFGEIGGLDEQLQQLRELVIFPLTRPDLFRHSRVAAQPSGILLFGASGARLLPMLGFPGSRFCHLSAYAGPPGTGKTLLAKAIAKEVRASFLTVNVATIQSKWYGESPKLVDALFSLARKRSPCVMFIDEIDGLSFLSQPWLQSCESAWCRETCSLVLPAPPCRLPYDAPGAGFCARQYP